MNTETQVANVPPRNTGKRVASDFPDDIRGIGDQVAGLTLVQARELVQYIERVHGIKLS